jgi:ABC-type uncharacterized transport system auxiliary subunit
LIRHYYILELPEESYQSNQDTLPGKGVCEILRAKIPPAYDQQRIAVRRRSHEISYYQYHYWAMNPAENLTALLEQQIQKSHIFSHSSSGILNRIPDYQITLDVYKLEVLDQDDIYSAGLEMRMELIDYRSGQSLLTHRFERTKALKNRDLNLFASELSIIFQEETQNFIIKVRSYFEKSNLRVPAEN